MRIKIGLLIFVFVIAITNLNAQDTTSTDKELLGLPGDNLDLYAVLDLFQESKTIEDFEESLNKEDTGINNLDLNLDDKVDFIKVVTKQDKNDFVFVLQVDVLKGEIQDVATILVSKSEEGKISLQIVGAEELYGKDYVIEPKPETKAVTANPAYSGSDTVVVKSAPATVVVLESEPIVQYVYSPVYVPYYPPYYYGYYPPYYRPYPVVSVTFYMGHHHHHHHHYHGGHYNNRGNTVVINNNKTYNNYNRNRNTSNTVNRNKSNGKYKNNNVSNRSTNGASKNSIKNNKTVSSSKKSGTKIAPSNTSKAKPSAKPNKPSNKSNVRPAPKPNKSPNRSNARPAQRPTNRSPRRR